MISKNEIPLNKSQSFLSTIGLCLSLLAFCVAATSPFILDKLDPAPPLEDIAIDKAFEIKEKIQNRLFGNETSEETVTEKETAQFSFAEILVPGVIITGLLGMVCGIIGFVRNEQKRMSLMAIGMGIGAIILQYSLIIAAVLVLIFFIGTILENLGIDI